MSSCLYQDKKDSAKASLLRGEGFEHRLGFVEPARAQQQSGQSDEGVAAPVGEPRIAGEDGHQPSACDVAFDHEVVAGDREAVVQTGWIFIQRGNLLRRACLSMHDIF
mgnify:CR=1 FL=1